MKDSKQLKEYWKNVYWANRYYIDELIGQDVNSKTKCQVTGCRRRGTIKYRIASRMNAGILPFTINLCVEDYYKINEDNKLVV